MQVNDDGRQKYEQVKEYQAQGLSMEQIAPKVGFKSKGSVSKLIQKFENKPVVSETFPQETTETQRETRDEKLPF
jgi:transposase